MQDLESNPPKTHRNGHPVKYLRSCPDPRMGSVANSLKKFMQLPAIPIVFSYQKRKATGDNPVSKKARSKRPKVNLLIYFLIGRDIQPSDFFYQPITASNPLAQGEESSAQAPGPEPVEQPIVTGPAPIFEETREEDPHPQSD